MATQLIGAGCFRVVFGLEGRTQKRVPGRSGGTAGQIHTAEEIGTVEQYRGRTGASAKGGRASGSKNQTKRGGGQAEKGRKRGGKTRVHP